MSDESIERARERFKERNAIAVSQTRERIQEVRNKAMETYASNLSKRQKKLQEVSHNLETTVRSIQYRHQLLRARLSQEAVSRDVHVRVNRSLEALEDFVRVQRESNISEERIIAALEDPAISGSAKDRRRRASVSELIQSAQKQLVQQTEFINIAAHELRTPIMPILINAEILEAEIGDGSEEVEAIKRNAVRLQHLAENILNVARIDSNSLSLRKEVFDLNSLLSQSIEDRVTGSSQVVLVSHLSEGALLVDADRGRIEQVVSNLLSNALKFTKEGEILVSSRVEGQKALVTVRDNGSGIEPEIFPLLFSKFSAKSQGGTGLGLFICKGIVEIHGGSITASNNVGSRGATFEFSLPLVEPRTAENEAAEAPAA
jgi:signal transduction histidine kinase